MRRADWSRIVDDARRRRASRCELVFSHWLGKATRDGHFVDLIFAGGNGWSKSTTTGWRTACRRSCSKCRCTWSPAEEMIWSKAFVMERERFDGADVTHILRKSGAAIDWVRLLRRFGPHAAVLLAHLRAVPVRVPRTIATSCPRLGDGRTVAPRRAPRSAPAGLCRGTLVSREQYLVDVTEWGYLDAREMPHGRMTPQQIQEWTAAIAKDK